MAILIKTIKNRKYAYLVSRGAKGKIVHTYLGATQHPKVVSLMALQKESSEIPKHLYWLFWDTNPQKIELYAFSKYIIERILELGNGKALKWLQLVFPIKKILEVVYTSRTLSEKSKIFWKIWFGVK